MSAASRESQGARVLLFDVMSTLVYDPFYVEMPAFFGLSFQELLEAKHPTAWGEFETSQIDEAQLFRIFFKDRRSIDQERFKACVKQAYRWLDGMQPLLAELHAQGCAMHALSNYPSWYDVIEERLSLSRYLRSAFVSCDTGLRKPDPEAYRVVLRKLDVPASACIFIDDQERNCRAAAALGMDAIHFEDAASLALEFAERGLLANPGA